ncbi:MAG: Sapep family Mn(2+)-dependent dipeptidase [Clostridiales bacterium]|nr:Sapep family Mn(2+)-dependent dipeptidase [Clostridiales bacterium]
MKYQEQIEQYIEEHKEEMLDDICELCGINSERMEAEEDMPFGPGAAECLDTALDIAEGYDFDVTDYDGYVGCVDLNEKPTQLNILAHLDVVPAGDGWTVTKPFRPLLKDGRLYGRGTADDKGPAVAALYAMRAVRDLKIPLKKNVRLILGTDEECGSSDIRYYYSMEEEAPMTFSPDASYPLVNIEKGRLPGHFTAKFAASGNLPRLRKVQAGTKINVVPGTAWAVTEGIDAETIREIAAWVSEKTGITYTVKEKADGETGVDSTSAPKGNKICLIDAEGKGAHAAIPEEGVNALTGLLTLLAELPLAACAQIDAVKELTSMLPHGDCHGTALGVDMEDELSGRLTLAFSMLTVTETGLDGSFDARVPICGNEENVPAVIAARMAEAGLTLQNQEMTAPHHVSGDSRLVRTLLECYETYTGREGRCESTGGGTYVHNLKNGVAFGASMPGTDNHMHGADEFAVVDELVVSAKIFAQAIVELCG